MISYIHTFTPGPSQSIKPFRQESSESQANALWRLGGLLNIYANKIVEIEPTRIRLEETGRNTNCVWRCEWTGSPQEMAKLLVLAYYYFDGKCVEPPADYSFHESYPRQRVLENIQATLPRRDLVATWLREQGITPINLDGVLTYDERGLGHANIGYAVAVGLSDSEDLKRASLGASEWSDFAAAATLAVEAKVPLSSLLD